MKLSLPGWFARVPSSSTRRPARAEALDIDVSLIGALVVILMLGLVMVYSASIALPDARRFANYEHTHFLVRQLFFVALGLLCGLVAFTVRTEVHQRLALPLFGAAIVLLVLVLVPGIGREVNGAYRWLPLGLFNMQPTEIMKLATLIYAADYAARKQDLMTDWKRSFLPIAVLMAMVSVLVMAQPDLGALAIIMAIAAGILFLGGVSLRLFALLTIAMGAFFVSMVLMAPWRRARFFAYLDPWEESNAQGKAYQLSHSLIAFGRGEWFGVGLGGSVEKLHYLPEAHTDFIFAVLGEELGFVGVAIVILLFLFVIRRCFAIGRQAMATERIYAALVAQGVGIWLAAQAFVNMGVALGLLPTKGLTLPFMSYGGSGMIVNLVAMAIVLRIDFENRVLARGGQP